MIAIDLSLPAFRFQIPHQASIAILVFVCAVAILLYCGMTFKKMDTTVDPSTPENASTLVVTGIYNLSRNPMYIAFLLGLTACFIYLGNYINVILLPAYVVLVNRLYITREEIALEKRFGEGFLTYKKRVRRWI